MLFRSLNITWTNRTLSDGMRIGIGVDITDLKRTRAELKETEIRWRRLVEKHPMPIFITVAGEFRYVNPATVQLLGVDAPADLIGTSAMRFIPPRLRPRIQERLAQLEEGQQTPPLQHTLKRTDGDERIVVIQSVPVQYQGTRAAQTVAIDVTDRVRQERELEAAKQKAEELNTLKSAFLANMSHEVRTPLTSILGFSDALREEDLPPPGDRFAEMIHRAGSRLMRTLNSVLDLSKVEAGAMTLSPERIHLGHEVEEIVSLFRREADAAGVHLSTTLSHTGNLWMVIDPGAFTTIVNNLLSNALKFTEQGGRVRVHLETTDSACRLSVCDTGVGIDPEFLPNLFEPFEQESSGTTRAFEGSGLGLTLTRELVHMMGGTIEVDSTKGEGTCFEIDLPRPASGE